MDDKIKKLILLFVPTDICNFRCNYCFISHTESWDNKMKFKYSAQQIVNGLKKDRLGGTCFINITANGETLLYKDLVPLTEGLLREGHYVEIVTNGTITKSIEKLLKIQGSLLKRLEFKISYHYSELERTNMKEKFWANVKAIKKSPCSFSLEMMPDDSLRSKRFDICADCMSNVGALCHATVGRNDAVKSKDLLTELSKSDYAETWGILDSEMFRFKLCLFGKKRKEFCYAGKWSLLINLATGDAYQCYGRPSNQNVFDNPQKKLKFMPVGYSCLQPFCFNGHSHLALGMIPSLETPYYNEIRDRNCVDGSTWLKEDCKRFFNQKLFQNNREYTKLQRIGHAMINPIYLLGNLFYNLPDTLKKARKFIRINTGKYAKKQYRE